MPKDPLLHHKLLLRPGERLPRDLERQAEEWRESVRDEIAEEAREEAYQRSEADYTAYITERNAELDELADAEARQRDRRNRG